MGKKSSSSGSKAPAAKLNLTALLGFTSNPHNADPQCEELLGGLYQEIFANADSEGTKSTFRNGGGPRRRYQHAAAYLKDHPEIRDHILGFWTKWPPDPNLSSFSTDIIAILDSTDFSHVCMPGQREPLNQWLRRRAESGDAHDRAELMTTLTLLACTIGCWHDVAGRLLPEGGEAVSAGILPQEADLLEQIHGAEKRKDFEEVTRLLKTIIDGQLCHSSSLGAYYYRLSLAFEQLRARTMDPHQQQTHMAGADEALNMACEYDHPEALLQMAQEFWDKRKLEACYNYYKRAAEAGTNTQTGGEACWRLYQMGKADYASPGWRKDAEGYLKLASQYGYPEAVKKYREENAVTLSDQLPRSADTSTGIFCVNADNAYARTLLATNPDSWILGSDSMTEAPRDRLARKYFFLDDDHARNISQALRLLQSIKNSAAQRNDIAIYLRAAEEQAAPLIDTALACMGDTVIPVRILDDDRLAARVLGYHPLYYPIRRLADDAAAELNFVVVGDSRCCEWLVREAFWMTTFRNRKITSKITVLAPGAEKMLEGLMQHCPAMADAGKRPQEHKDDPLTRDFPHIRAISCDYDSKEFHSQMEALLGTRYLYIAVDAGSDLQNMELATSLRECAIRSAVKSGSIQADSMPAIAFRCADTDIASLSRRTVVLNEASGNLWYNNYNMIPFGVTGDQYSWDGLTRDLVEELSLDIHMVYCGIDPQADRGSERWAEARNSYFQRSYNRDSSIAVALSLGYRLYQYCDGPILPEFWDILDRDAIFSEQALKRLSEKIGTEARPDDTMEWDDQNGNHHIEVIEGSTMSKTQALAQWEHDRWNRFMISRGWMPATMDQMRTYRSAGNLRQQLYIGRLHPFICPYEDLAALEKELKKEIRKYDIHNIAMTGPILARKWTQPQRLLERSRERTDRERTR